MPFDLPRDTIVPVHSVTVRLDGAGHPFESDNGKAIDENWRREIEANPALFDGQVVLLSKLVYDEGRLEGLCHTIRFATFLEWRRTRPLHSAEHAYACAIPVTSDNALIAIRMGDHTSNAGKIYFAGGSFEPQDFPGGVADLHLNMAREVGEETGIDISGLARDAHFYLRSSNGASVLFRRYYLGMPAEQAVEKINHFIAGEEEPEIEEPVIIRDPANLPDNILPHMPALVEWHFANPRPLR